MLADMIDDEMRTYAAATVDDRWAAQVAALPVTVPVTGPVTGPPGQVAADRALAGRPAAPGGGGPWWGNDGEYLTAWQARAGGRTSLGGLLGTVATAIEILHQMRHLAVLDRLLPLPGTATGTTGAATSGTASGTGTGTGTATGTGTGASAGSGTGTPDRPAKGADDRVLGRIRALLAKAESTEFPEEAEALSGRAQELMAKYSIDHALLAARAGEEEAPGGRRIGVDNPYESAKVQLLTEVARANRCRTVWLRELGLVTVIGFRADLDAVELLFTSLLVQANTAMMRAGAKRDAAGRSRTRSFRQSFLISYAYRIGERLAGAADQAVREAAGQPGGDPADGRPGTASPGTDLVPLLAAREEAIDDTVREMFGDGLTVTRAARATDAEGWNSGRAAADLASLHNREPVTD
ncbi:MAG: DUF2786 domain-containing protein [Nocardiopsaceae bacterium]|nr:DUF2786 domain-containing protein [Nocardiopsaceae bacterium]